MTGTPIVDDKFNIVDILLMDHRYLKKCIEVLKDEDESEDEKLFFGKSFLDTLKKHSLAEKQSVYSPLLEMKDIHSIILECQIEHGIVYAKVEWLIPKLNSENKISDETEAELKVLAELVEHHLKEEEHEMIPKIEKNLDSEILNEIGFQFFKLRGFTTKDLEDYPDLQEEVTKWSHGHEAVSSQYLNKVHQYVNEMTH